MSDSFTVLAADDSMLARKFVAKCLAGSEFELVEAVGTGREAVDRYAALSPDVVLLDVVMPDMKGLEALRIIREQDAAARAVIVSSLGTDQAVSEATEAGAWAYLQKPFEAKQLLTILRTAVASKRSS